MDKQPITVIQNMAEGISDRFIEEKERIEMDTTDFVKLAESTLGMSRPSVYKYVKQERTPNFETLLLLAAHGADLQFMLSGIRSPNAHEVHACLKGVSIDDTDMLVREAQEILNILAKRAKQN